MFLVYLQYLKIFLPSLQVFILLKHDLGRKINQHDVQNFLSSEDKDKAEFTMLSSTDYLYSKNVRFFTWVDNGQGEMVLNLKQGDFY